MMNLIKLENQNMGSEVLDTSVNPPSFFEVATIGKPTPPRESHTASLVHATTGNHNFRSRCHIGCLLAIDNQFASN